MNVTALAIGRGGELFAATSPDGKVYRIDSTGKATVYFDPKEKYIWSLAVMPDGSLAVGTGENGRIYRVRSANAELTLHYYMTQARRVSFRWRPTKPEISTPVQTRTELVLRFGADGKAFALLDSSLREVHQLASGTDGSVYALAIGESAAVAKPSETPANPAAENKTVRTHTTR